MPAPELSQILRRAQAEQRAPSASAAVVRGGEVVWAEAVGLADVEAGREATPETQYPIASITKSFVAASVMQLRDAGVLELDDPLDRHLPESPSTASLRRLLAHLGGLQREVPGDRVWETLEFPTRDELLARLGDVSVVLEPGLAWHYSNLAFVLLGEVVARRAGVPFEDYVRARLLEPLGLERTTWGSEEPAARGYLVHPFADSVMPEPVTDRGGTGAAGGLWSTPSDLVRWGSFLVEPDPAVLAASSAAEMRTLQTMAEPQRWTLGWGLGLVLYRAGERVLVGHDGGAIGGVSVLAVEPEQRVGAAVVANTTSGFSVQRLAFELVDAAIEGASPAAWRPAGPPPPEITPVLGRWWSEGTEFVFSWREGRLEARLAGSPEWREPAVFEPAGEDRFRTVSGRERGEWLELVREPDGSVAKLYWATYPFTRDPRPFGSSAADGPPV
ncbi:MAG TPA: serine hydrolase domain-containing protein [Gaiellaceae bacterium]